MIPIWKIKREIKSLRDQLDALIELLVSPIRQKLSDPRLVALTKIQDGYFALGGKVAILLIFQPNGIPASVVVTCQYLSQKGYAVLLVSNCVLTDHDQNILAPFVWRFVQRINYGYDFGGYRDGIRLLWHWSVTPDNLLILNDSIWFPLGANSTMVEEMENSPAQFLGAIRHVESESLDDTNAGFFLSYLFLIKKSLFISSVFTNFWKNYVATSSKYLTVRRGERGFSKAMFTAGVINEGIYSRERFVSALQAVSPDRLRLILKYGAYTDDKFISASGELLNKYEPTEVWKRQAILHIDTVSRKRNFHSSFCFGSISILGIPFLKKNKGELQVRMRQQYVQAVMAGDLPRPCNLVAGHNLVSEASGSIDIEFSGKVLSEISSTLSENT